MPNMIYEPSPHRGWLPSVWLAPGHMHLAGRSFERSNRPPHGALGLGQCQGRSAKRAGLLPFPPAAVRVYGRGNLRMVPLRRASRTGDPRAYPVRRAAKVPGRLSHRHCDDRSGDFGNGWLAAIGLRRVFRHSPQLRLFSGSRSFCPVSPSSRASRNSSFAAGFSHPSLEDGTSSRGLSRPRLHLRFSIIPRTNPCG